MHGEQTLVPTPLGDARITRFAAGSGSGAGSAAGAGSASGSAAGARRATLMLGHGAGGGIEAPDLQALAAALPAQGIEVALVEQPWRVAGKRLAPAPKTLDVAWRAILADAADEPASGGVPLIVGGRSAGARVACRTGRETGAHAVLALAFPLHPPGKPAQSRAAELLGSGLPTLVVQGAVDPFGGPEAFPPLPPTHRLVGLPAGGHEFKVRKTQEPVLGLITAAVAAWISSLV
ncbi:MAG TPA: alpha/beta family hydrolase [Actinospica sp.]|nr:alpha/beta family hydrolase [Actinospica sp.]